MKTKLYKIKKGFAVRNKIPIYFVGKPIIETDKAIYLYGHGTIETARMGVCCVCGRTLTHPVSVELGIGPECGKHYWNWDLVGGYSKENIERLKQIIREDIKVDGWIPKSTISETLKTNEEVIIPSNHPKLNNSNSNNNSSRRAILVKYQKSEKFAIKIQFPFNREDLDLVRTLPDRKWNAEEKHWIAPLSVDAVEMLKEWRFTLDPRLEEYLQHTKANVDQIDEIEIPGLKYPLYPFQKKGVAFIEHKQGRALIADEMGLGKTIQALAWLMIHPELRPVIIVVPASLKLNWAREAEKWMDSPKIQILSGTNIDMGLFGELIIINYDILLAWIEKLQTINIRVLITDECHYFKNNKAKRTKAIKKLSKNISHIIALSGTPIVNRPREIDNAIRIIDPTILPSFWETARKFYGARHNGFGWTFDGATNTNEFHSLLINTIMLRRLKRDVLSDLPEKTRSYVPMELNNEKEYAFAENNFIQFVQLQKGREAAQRASNAETLAEIEGLKQLAVKGKLTQCIDWIRNFLNVDGKLIIFATHRFVINSLMEEFGNIAVKVDGSVTGANRQKAVDTFQNDDKIQLFIGNIKAAGVGITLTAASNVVFLELPWTPGEVTQAEDRCHRIGQRNSVNINYLLAANTIEEKIAKLIDKKRKVLDSVLDGKVTESESLLSELMKEYES